MKVLLEIMGNEHREIDERIELGKSTWTLPLGYLLEMYGAHAILKCEWERGKNGARDICSVVILDPLCKSRQS